MRVLANFVAFKWIKTNKLSGGKLDLIMPDSVHDRSGQGRMGNRYTCEALACGPKATQVKPGDRFLLHEYGKVDQGDPWKEDEVMFVEEQEIIALLDSDADITILAKPITDKMMDEYEDL